MRYGFTTGSCAAAAAKAAAYMLLTGNIKNEITIETPKKLIYRAEVLDIDKKEQEVSCAVEKDGGDDPDITTGTLIYAKVSKCEMSSSQENKRIIIDGGTGVGRVTRAGLDQPVGNAAINHVPRQMIEKEVMQVCDMLDYNGGLKVLIYVPDGEKIAEHTFNERLGIKGGISILGTSGIVEPMSTKAIIDTIKIQLNQRHVLGSDCVVVSPGNYGLEFIKNKYGYDLDKSVKCSNFIGETIDMAAELGYKKLLLAGHIGKLIKVAGGIMNTHSREADCRMEIITACAIKSGVSMEYLKRILDCATTQEALYILEECGKLSEVMNCAMDKICFYLNKRAQNKLQIECIMYSNESGELAKTSEVEEWFTLLGQEPEQRI